MAKNATFQEFVQAVADKALKASVDKAGDGEDVCAILDMQSELEEKTLTIGEKLSIRRFQKITGDCVASYIHGGGRIGVLPEYRKKGANALIFADLIEQYHRYGFKWAEIRYRPKRRKPIDGESCSLNPFPSGLFLFLTAFRASKAFDFCPKRWEGRISF